MRISRPFITGITFAVAVALASPAWAQAKSRTTGSSSSSGSAKSSGGSSSSGSASSRSSGSSRGGDSGGASSSSSSGSRSRGGSLMVLPDQRAASREPQKTAPQKTTQTAAPRGRSGSGDDPAASRQPSQTPRGGTNDERSGIITERRTRDGRPIVGSAGERPERSLGGGLIIVDGGVWSPFFSPGFGWNAGFVSHNPWRFSHGWYFGRYGPWGYDPFWSPWGYDPYYDPYWDQRYGRGYGQVPSQPERIEPTTGSIRLRVTPESALVIIDGTQVGVVDDFNGLSGHLELTAGTHQLELRAQGYEPMTKTITVRAGKTLTERLSLKKVQ